MINSISEQGRLQRLYTQNIDCLEIQLPYLQTEIPLTFKQPYPKTIQLHGNVNLLSCSKCSYIRELDDDYLKSKQFGERTLIRTCPECEEMNQVRKIAGKRQQSSGILRPRIVLYNEFHPDGEVIGNITESDLKSKPDCLIISGTTLKIPGVRRLVKEMAKVVHSRNGYIIWVNLDEPSQTIVDYVEYFDLIVVGDCQLVPGLVSLYDLTVVNAPKKKKRAKKQATPKSVKKSCKGESGATVKKESPTTLKKKLTA
ncbi:unnamed protein product [Ambrosiozyma monospora]|uniref:Unnamed protein product n=1 Tax=Ambrosiozyma monospora TaxID=43982 RepID=A0ACB5T7Q4_AMBMO|nr:unnamed protein product [Ambrosiozyma monospora]